MVALIMPYQDRVEKCIDNSTVVRNRIRRITTPKLEEYSLRCAEAEHLKLALRKSRRKTYNLDYEKDKELSYEFWSEYEDINRRLLPEDPVYSGSRGGVTLSTTVDLWTYTSAASGQSRLLEFSIGGESTASTVLRLGMYMSSSGATPTNQTPEKFNTRSPAAAGTFATTWTTQPTLNSNPLFWFAFNTFGGADKWIAAPGSEIYLVNGEKASARSASGTPGVSAHLIFEEL